MAEPIISDLTLTALERALDGTALQQRITAGNIANLETPGYMARRVSFQDSLRAALAAQREGRPHAAELLDAAGAAVGRDMSAPTGPDGNNVDIEREMTDLSEAGLRYEALVRLIRRKFQMLGTVIGDGRQ